MKYIKQKPLSLLLLAFPCVIIAQFFYPEPILIFALSGIGLIPLAGYLGEATA